MGRNNRAAARDQRSVASLAMLVDPQERCEPQWLKQARVPRLGLSRHLQSDLPHCLSILRGFMRTQLAGRAGWRVSSTSSSGEWRWWFFCIIVLTFVIYVCVCKWTLIKNIKHVFIYINTLMCAPVKFIYTDIFFDHRRTYVLKAHGSLLRANPHGCASMPLQHVSNILLNKLLVSVLWLLCPDVIGGTGCEYDCSTDVDETARAFRDVCSNRSSEHTNNTLPEELPAC